MLDLTQDLAAFQAEAILDLKTQGDATSLAVGEIKVCLGELSGKVEGISDQVKALSSSENTLKVPVPIAKALVRSVAVVLAVAFLALGGYQTIKALGVEASAEARTPVTCDGAVEVDTEDGSR